MFTYSLSPIFIRPSFPSIQSTPSSSKDPTPATSSPESPRQVAPHSDQSKSAEVTPSTTTTSSISVEDRTPETLQAWQQHTTSPPMAPTSPWYTQTRHNLQALHLRIPCSAYTTRHRQYLQQHPPNSNATTALYPPPHCPLTPTP